MAKIEDIEGIGPVFGAKLRAAGIATVENLLEAGASPAGRNTLAEKTGTSASTILEWVNRADLARVKGIGSEYADLLESAGVDTVPELARRNAENLTAAMTKLNEEKKLVRRIPTSHEVSAWIAEAAKLPKVVTY